MQRGENVGLESIDVVLFDTSGTHGTIQSEALARAGASFARCSSTGVEGILVKTDIENRIVFVENLLRAVAVMHIPIDDRYPFGAVSALGIPCTDSHIVEQTESHDCRALSVVTWWTHRGECARKLSRHYFVNGPQHTASR